MIFTVKRTEHNRYNKHKSLFFLAMTDSCLAKHKNSVLIIIDLCFECTPHYMPKTFIVQPIRDLDDFCSALINR
jgi:hypothetical protein